MSTHGFPAGIGSLGFPLHGGARRFILGGFIERCRVFCLGCKCGVSGLLSTL